MNIAVGSRKPYKLKAATSACEMVFGDGVIIHGVSVESGVSPQPMDIDESIVGARNRAVAALSQSHEACEIGIGIENTLVNVGDGWFATTWIVAVDHDGTEGMALSLLRPVPPGIMDLVGQGRELSDAVRDLFGNASDSGYDGLIGLITQGALNRHDVLRDGIVASLSAIVNDRLFKL